MEIWVMCNFLTLMIIELFIRVAILSDIECYKTHKTRVTGTTFKASSAKLELFCWNSFNTEIMIMCLFKAYLFQNKRILKSVTGIEIVTPRH